MVASLVDPVRRRGASLVPLIARENSWISAVSDLTSGYFSRPCGKVRGLWPVRHKRKTMPDRLAPQEALSVVTDAAVATSLTSDAGRE